jgi:single-stranded DNA-binding protein
MNDLLSGSHLKLIGQGRISRLGKLQSVNGKRIFKFSVAYNLMRHVEYVNYVAYDKQADYLEQYATTGTTVYVESVPHTNRYQDPKSDKEKFISKTDYRVETISFISNLKGTSFKNERGFTDHEIAEFRDEVKDVDHISIAKKVLEEKGYTITEPQDQFGITAQVQE